MFEEVSELNHPLSDCEVYSVYRNYSSNCGRVGFCLEEFKYMSAPDPRVRLICLWYFSITL